MTPPVLLRYLKRAIRFSTINKTVNEARVVFNEALKAMIRGQSRAMNESPNQELGYVSPAHLHDILRCGNEQPNCIAHVLDVTNAQGPIVMAWILQSPRDTAGSGDFAQSPEISTSRIGFTVLRLDFTDALHCL